jgi:molybdopterin-binding protein
MNRFQTVVLNIIKTNNIAVIKLSLNSKIIFTAISLELPQQIKNKTFALIGFKPTSVIISLEEIKNISVSNKFKCNINKINCSDILCELFLKTDFGIVETILLKEIVQKLNLQENRKVYAYIKPNEISILEFSER